MTLLIIGLLILVIAIASGNKKKQSGINTEKQAKFSRDTIQKQDKVINELYRKPMPNEEITFLDASGKDDSIIDVSGETYQINYQNYGTRPANTGGYNFEAVYWGIGTKYKEKLRLTDAEVKMLDALIDTSNKFNTIEFIAIEIIRLFFDIQNHLTTQFANSGTSLQEQTNLVAELELTQHYKLWKNSKSYNEQLPLFANTINQIIYKICENSFRDHFFIGRKTDFKWYMHSKAALAAFDSKFYILIQQFLPQRLQELKATDDVTEAELNDYNKGRWKNKLELLKDNCTVAGPTTFYESVVELGNQNKTNPSVENIFFDASKYVSKFDKRISLKLYVHYIYFDLFSVTFDNRQLAKTIQKSLFNSNEQLKDFEAIINALIEDKEIEKALDAVSKLYAPKRRKIQLDTSKIKEVQERHSDTVELLNEYLQDENEVEQVNEKVKEEVGLNINYSNEAQASLIYKNSNKLSAVQEETLNLFAKRGFSITVVDFDSFARSKSVFKNSLIEGINDIYFEDLDDVLVEDNGDEIEINEIYYNKILNK